MTVGIEDIVDSYTGDGTAKVFPYGFTLPLEEWLVVMLDGEPTIDYSVDVETKMVTMDVVPAIGVIVTLTRLVPADQEIDYTPYDQFPAETHEFGLDKLTMLVQQALAFEAANIHIPSYEASLGINTEVPNAEDRAQKFLYFDADGNVTAIEANVFLPAIYRIVVNPGISGRPDSTKLLEVDTVSLSPNVPLIGFTNINQPDGPVQLDGFGKIPLELLSFIGIRPLGFFRGDNFCPKRNDPDDPTCSTPDYRNPSELYPELVGTFTAGDYFIVTLQGQNPGDPAPSEGGINLYLQTGDPTPTLATVKGGDGLMFLNEIIDPNDGVTIISQEGWYYIPEMVSATTADQTLYDDNGNVYVQGDSVQGAIDDVDTEFKTRDAFYLTAKNANMDAKPTPDDGGKQNLSVINASGFYYGLDTTENTPVLGNFYSVVHIQLGPDVSSQTAVDLVSAEMWTRRENGGAFGDWVKVAVPSDLQDTLDAAEARAIELDADQTALLQAEINLKKDSADFSRTGDVLTITNVPVV